MTRAPNDQSMERAARQAQQQASSPGSHSFVGRGREVHSVNPCQGQRYARQQICRSSHTNLQSRLFRRPTEENKHTNAKSTRAVLVLLLDQHDLVDLVDETNANAGNARALVDAQQHQAAHALTQAIERRQVRSIDVAHDALVCCLAMHITCLQQIQVALPKGVISKHTSTHGERARETATRSWLIDSLCVEQSLVKVHSISILSMRLQRMMQACSIGHCAVCLVPCKPNEEQALEQRAHAKGHCERTDCRFPQDSVLY